MTETAATPLEATTQIAAPPEKVWSLVADPRAMARFSPQVVRSFVRGGGSVGLGTTFVNVNRRGLLVWPTQAKVVRYVEGKDFAFRVKENYTVWSFELEAVDGGTRVTQRREVPQGISNLSLGLTKRVLGGVDTFTAELQQGMAETLAKVKAEAER